MTRLSEDLGVVEVRETPDGIERMGRNKPSHDGLVTAITLAFRTGRNKPWLEATAGSVIIVDEKKWLTWEVVEGDALAG